MRAVCPVQLLPFILHCPCLVIFSNGSIKQSFNFHDFQEPTIQFHDFPGLENEMLKFHDFPFFMTCTNLDQHVGRDVMCKGSILLLIEAQRLSPT